MGRRLDGGLLLGLPVPLTRRALALRLVLALAGMACAAAPAHARELRAGPLTLQGPASVDRSLEALAARAVTMLPALEADLGLRFRDRFRMHLIPERGAEDSAVRALDATAPEWAAGYVVPARRVGAIRVARSRQYPYGTLESVLAHEATHVLLYDAGARGLPLWFQEGVATLEGRKWSLEDVMIYSSALLTADLPSLAELEAAFHGTAAEAEVAYAASFAFVSRSARRGGPGFLKRVLHAAQDRPFAEAWRDVAGVSLADAERAWRRDSLIRYRWLPILTASSTLWIGVSFLALFVAARRRQRIKLQREQWARDERQAEEEGGLWIEETPPQEPAPSSTSPPAPADPETDRVR